MESQASGSHTSICSINGTSGGTFLSFSSLVRLFNYNGGYKVRLKFIFIFCAVLTSSCAHVSRQILDTEHFELMFGKVIVPVSVNGIKMKFLLDTGCGTSGFIRESLVQTYNLPKVPGKSAQSGGWGGTKKEWITHFFYKADKFQVGKNTFTNVELLGRKDFWEYDVDGMICAGLLKKDQNLYLDFKDQSFLVTPKEITLSHSLPFVYQDEREILVVVKINGTDVANFNFDTGSHVVHIAQEMSEKLNLKSVQGEEIQIGDTKGDIEKAKFVIAPYFCLGELCAKDLKLVSSGIHQHQKDFQRNGILGYPFFQGHKFIISFPKKIIYYE